MSIDEPVLFRATDPCRDVFEFDYLYEGTTYCRKGGVAYPVVKIGKVWVRDTQNPQTVSMSLHNKDRKVHIIEHVDKPIELPEPAPTKPGRIRAPAFSD